MNPVGLASDGSSSYEKLARKKFSTSARMPLSSSPHRAEASATRQLARSRTSSISGGA
jgi:hypothetical protein